MSFSTTFSRDRVKAARDHHPKKMLFSSDSLSDIMNYVKKILNFVDFFFAVHNSLHISLCLVGRREEHTQSLRYKKSLNPLRLRPADKENQHARDTTDARPKVKWEKKPN